MSHVSNEKKKIVQEFNALAKNHPIIVAVNLEGLPTPQLQTMRAQLRAKNIVLKMTKKRILKIILESAGKKGLEKLVPYLVGHPAIIFTNENPFVLFKTLEKNKSSAPAKGGQIAPKDIVVPAGPTGFAPGPIIGELGQIGIKAGIDAGKVVIKQDSVVVKEGQVIKPNVAAILTRLKIEPMEIGLNIIAAYEDGEIFTKQLLRIDEKEFKDNLTKAHTWAFNLAVDAGVYNTLTIEHFISKSHREARAVAISENVLEKEVVGDILAKAEMHMNAINALMPN